ncbi:MAG: hypothetical protein IJF32_10590, partial [Oscillospiraceae bacterium]|nr:hypothetical protein [Oscillospiraceae bacterium]
MNIQGAGLDLIRNPDKFYDWIGLKQSPGTASTKTTQAAKTPFVQKPKKEKDLFLEGFYSVADKPKEERRSYTSPLAKSRAILDSISQTKPAKRVVEEEEDDFLKGFYSVADRPKEETPISAQPPTVQKNTQTTYKPINWIRSTMTQPNPWNAKNTDFSPQKVNYASQTNTSATPSQNTRTGESRDEYDSRVRQQYAARRQAEEDARYADYDVEAAQSRLDDYSAWTDKLIESRKNGNGFDGDYDVVAERNALEAEIKRAKAAQERNRARTGETRDEYDSRIRQQYAARDRYIDFSDTEAMKNELSDIEAAKNHDFTSKWYKRLERAWDSGDLETYERVEKEMETQKKRIEYILENRDRMYKDNFTGQFGANYRAGRMSQDEALAWNEYLE